MQPQPLARGEDAKNLKWTTMPTIRQKIISLLSEEELSAREISGDVGISEKEVIEHLSHISRSVASQNKRVIITPARVRDLAFLKFATRPPKGSKFTYSGVE